MSDIDQLSNNGSLPESSNASDMDYPDEDISKTIFPSKEKKEDRDSSLVSINPSKMRIFKKIETILPNNTTEFLELISEIYYKWKTFGTKYPEKYTDMVKYIDSRI